ncbi:MAG: ABC transporter ATP-binding protein [Tissierellia bacterium]|nr:ABC transporter ATP-binding protein [Tissierellia bacterium]
MFKKFKWFMSYYKKKLTLAIFFLLLSDIVGLIPPYITGRLTDRIFDNSITLKVFILIIILDLFVILIKYILAILWSYFTFRGSNEMEYLARDRMMSKILKQSLQFFEKHSTGSLMGKATNDVNTLVEFAGYGTLSFFDSCIYPIFIVIVMIVVVDLKLTLMAILPLPLLAYLCIKIGDKIYEKFTLVQRVFDKLNGNVLEDVEGIRIIRVFNLQNSREDAFKQRGQDLCNRNLEVVKYQALMTPIQRIIPAFTFIIAIGYGSYLISNGKITVGQLVSFTYYLNMLIWPMYALGNFINLKQQAGASMDRIQEIWDYPEDIVENPQAKPLHQNPKIQFKDFSFRYPSSKNNVLEDVNVDIYQGKSLGVLGKTGSGKTTFLKQLLSLYPKDDDHILLDGKTMDSYTIHSVRDKLGYVPQEHMIFSKSIRDNIKLSKPDATEQEVMDVISLADLEKDLDVFVDGLDTLCGERGVSLSGGQKQRISLARALLKDPDILILDDAMSAVDGETEQRIIENLQRNRQGKTTIIACHRISQVIHCDEIIVFQEGRIIERGHHDQLLAQKGWYREQYRNQMAKSRVQKKVTS